MAKSSHAKQSFRRHAKPVAPDQAEYPCFDEGRRTFLRHFGLLIVGGAAGAALAGCGDDRVVGAKPDTRGPIPDSSGVATDLRAPVDPPNWSDMGGTPDAKPSALDTAPPDTQPHYPDSGAAPMPLDAATRADAGVGGDAGT